MRYIFLLLLISGQANADGSDDPNFYRDFNPNNALSPGGKYEKFAPNGFENGRWHYGNVEPLPNTNCIYSWQGCNRPQGNIPEPGVFELLGVGIAGFILHRKMKK